MKNKSNKISCFNFHHFINIFLKNNKDHLYNESADRLYPKDQVYN